MADDSITVTRRAMDVEDYIDIARRHKGWIFGPTFAALVVGVVAAYLWPDTYLSTAIIRVVPQAVPEAYVPSNITTDLQGEINGLAQVIMNRAALTTIIQKYQLYRKEISRLPMEDVIENMKKTDIQIGALQTLTQTSQGRQAVPAFRIGFQYTNRFIAQKVANDLVSNFLSESQNETTSRSIGTSDLLKTQLDQAKAKLDQCDQKLQDFRVKNLGHMPDQQQGNYSQLTALQTTMMSLDAAMSRFQSDKMELETQQRGLKQQLSQLKDPNAELQQVIDQKNEKLAAKDKEIEQAENYLAHLRERYTEQNPDVQNYVHQIVVLRKQREVLAKEDASKKAEPPAPLAPNPQFIKDQQALQRLIELVAGRLDAKEVEMKDVRKRQEQVTASIREIQGRLDSTPLGEKDYSELNSEHLIALQQYTDAEQKYNMSEKANQVQNRRQGEKLEILDPANIPMTPTEPKRPVIIGIAAALGLVLGLVLAGGREMKNTSLKNLKDVRAYTRLQVLGSIPLLENDLVVRRRRRLALLAWATACLVGIVIMSSSVVYYYNTRV